MTPATNAAVDIAATRAALNFSVAVLRAPSKSKGKPTVIAYQATEPTPSMYMRTGMLCGGPGTRGSIRPIPAGICGGFAANPSAIAPITTDADTITGISDRESSPDLCVSFTGKW